MRNTTSRLLGAAVIVLALSGCGAGDEEKASEAIAQSLRENQDETFPVDDADAQCVADGMVEQIGVDQLVDYGFLTEDLEARDEPLDELELEQEDADGAAGVFVECVDVRQVLVDSISESLGGQMDADMESCMQDALSDEVVREFLATVFAGDQEAATQLVTEELSGCATG